MRGKCGVWAVLAFVLGSTAGAAEYQCSVEIGEQIPVGLHWISDPEQPLVLNAWALEDEALPTGELNPKLCFDCDRHALRATAYPGAVLSTRFYQRKIEHAFDVKTDCADPKPPGCKILFREAGAGSWNARLDSVYPALDRRSGERTIELTLTGSVKRLEGQLQTRLNARVFKRALHLNGTSEVTSAESSIVKTEAAPARLSGEFSTDEYLKELPGAGARIEAAEIEYDCQLKL